MSVLHRTQVSRTICIILTLFYFINLVISKRIQLISIHTKKSANSLYRIQIQMNTMSSKHKSTLFTLDTFGHNSATFEQSLFQKDHIRELSNQNHFGFRNSGEQIGFDEQYQNAFSSRVKIDHRKRYIYRVLGDDSHQRLPSIKYQHVFIYDWDDTLICTTYLKGKKSTDLSQQTKKYLNELDDIVFNILDYSLKKGFVFIITNSLDGWIRHSSKTYLPKVYQKLSQSQKIIMWSARQLFEHQFPSNIKMWKVMAFKKLKQHLRINILTNVICVGDREDDLQACDVLVKEFELIYVKKIKLQERPRPQQLIKELKVLEKKFQQIFHAIANTTIKLQKRILTPQNIRKNSPSQSITIKTEKKQNNR